MLGPLGGGSCCLGASSAWGAVAFAFVVVVVLVVVEVFVS